MKRALILIGVLAAGLLVTLHMLPGVLATLLLNVTALITAMGLARERSLRSCCSAT